MLAEDIDIILAIANKSCSVLQTTVEVRRIATGTVSGTGLDIIKGHANLAS